MIAFPPRKRFVITAPSALDDQTFEQVLEQLATVPFDARLIVDARGTSWASPYALTALLALAQTRMDRPQFLPPEQADTVEYWSRAGFFRYAQHLYEIMGRIPAFNGARESASLLEITPLASSEDVHAVIEHVKDRLARIITQNLRLESRAVLGFAMVLAEGCQFVVEHGGRGGWVAAQNFNYRRRMGQHVLQIGLCSAGFTIRELTERQGRAAPVGVWSDGMALEANIIQAASHFPDHGRGQGFKGIRGYLSKWKGKMAVRSGTSRVAVVPAWDDDVVRRDRLAPFPGFQVMVMIPQSVE